MKKPILLIIILLLASQTLSFGQNAPVPKPEAMERHEFVISNFKTESELF